MDTFIFNFVYFSFLFILNFGQQTLSIRMLTRVLSCMLYRSGLHIYKAGTERVEPKGIFVVINMMSLSMLSIRNNFKLKSIE